jgi:hypothetical protein
MPDKQRALILFRIFFWIIIVMMYSLGGISLYLRERYLQPTPSPTPVISPAPDASPSDESDIDIIEPELPVPDPTITPAPTLFPTMTPPAGAMDTGGSEIIRPVAAGPACPPGAPPT